MRLRRRWPPAAMFAFCERATATPMSQEHIRRVGPEGLKNGGGAPDTTLCGAPLQGGWDLTTAQTNHVTDAAVRDLSTPRQGDGRVFLCPRCGAAWPAR
jgi:hypothetical protein